MNNWRQSAIMRMTNAKIDDVISELQRIRNEHGNLPVKNGIHVDTDKVPIKIKDGRYRSKTVIIIEPNQ